MCAKPRVHAPSRHELFRWTLDSLLAGGLDRDSGGWRGLKAKMSFAGWMLLSTANHPFARGRRFRAALLQFFWQLWRRLPTAGAQVVLQGGEHLWCPGWSGLGGLWVSVGYHETELVLVRDLVRADDVVVDVGANIGVYTVVSALRGARVLAFEPNADARLLLFANIELNEIRERVQVLSYGLGNFSGRAGFTTDLEERNHLAAGTELGRELIEVRRLDELLLPAGRLALMKIDVEGYDEAVLEGAVETIKKHRPVMIIETWAGGESIRRFLGSLGYSFFIYRSSLQPISEDFAEDANLIAIHTEEIGSVRQRLLGSAPNVEMLPRVRWLRSPEWTESGSARQP